MKSNRGPSHKVIWGLGGCFAVAALCGMSFLGISLIMLFNQSQVDQAALQLETAPTVQVSIPNPIETIPQTNLAIALQGHWKYTEIFGSGDLTVVTAYHLILNSDGSFQVYVEKAGATGEGIESQGEGTWTATPTQIFLKDINGVEESLNYMFYDGRLIFNQRYDQAWERSAGQP